MPDLQRPFNHYSAFRKGTTLVVPNRAAQDGVLAPEVRARPSAPKADVAKLHYGMSEAMPLQATTACAVRRSAANA